MSKRNQSRSKTPTKAQFQEQALEAEHGISMVKNFYALIKRWQSWTNILHEIMI